MREKRIIKISILIIIMILSLVLLTGCGRPKNSKQIKKYIKEKYNIDIEIVSVEDGDKEKKYTVKQTDRDVTFECTSKMVAINIDGSKFGEQEDTSDNYYSKLTESIQDDISRISQKYNIEFEIDDSISSGLVTGVYVNNSDISKIDFTNIENALNDLMVAYNLKKVPNLAVPTDIFIKMREQNYTSYYYTYTINGEKVVRKNSDEEFSDKWGIPDKLEQDLLNYANNTYGKNCYIEENSIVPMQGETWISYTIVNDKLKLKKEIRINLDKYKSDLNNNKLSNMDSYIVGTMDYVYN